MSEDQLKYPVLVPASLFNSMLQFLQLKPEFIQQGASAELFRALGQCERVEPKRERKRAPKTVDKQASNKAAKRDAKKKKPQLAAVEK